MEHSDKEAFRCNRDEASRIEQERLNVVSRYLARKKSLGKAVTSSEQVVRLNNQDYDDEISLEGLLDDSLEDNVRSYGGRTVKSFVDMENQYGGVPIDPELVERNTPSHDPELQEILENQSSEEGEPDVYATEEDQKVVYEGLENFMAEKPEVFSSLGKWWTDPEAREAVVGALSRRLRVTARLVDACFSKEE